MHAFLEWFCACRSGGMVRIGPEAHRYDDPYTFSVGFRISGRIATLTGTHAPQGGIKPAHKSAAQQALEREGYEVRWERCRHVPGSALSNSGVKIRRTITMSKIASIHHAKKPDGSYDAKTQATHLRSLADALEAGHCSLSDGVELKLADGRTFVSGIRTDH